MKYALSFFLLAAFLNIHPDYLYEETPLMKAAQKADIRAMQYCIAEGADVNEVAFRDFPHGGNPVLRYAIESGSIPAVLLLLGSDAMANEFTETGLICPEDKKANIRNLSLLCHAIYTDAPFAIIQALIAYGANLDGEPHMYGEWTPLMVAAYTGNELVVRLLVSLGVPLERKNYQDGRTALDYARLANHPTIVALLESLLIANNLMVIE